MCADKERIFYSYNIACNLVIKIKKKPISLSVINQHCMRVDLDEKYNLLYLCNGMHSLINGIQSLINDIHSLINGIHSLHNGIHSLHNGIQSPINGIQSPINGVQSPINGIQSLINGMQSPLNWTKRFQINFISISSKCSYNKWSSIVNIVLKAIKQL
jgi:hypothetical protein